MSKLPPELILQLIKASDAIDEWLLATGEEHVGIAAAIAIRRISNSITDLITDSEVGDAQFAADNCDWPCLSQLRGLVNPYYEDTASGIVIYHGDCRDVLPTLGRFDLLLTDPPYGIGEDGGAQRTRNSKSTNGTKQNWDKDRGDPQAIQAAIAMTLVQVIWGGNYFTDILPVSRGWLYWQKLMGGDFSDGELAWTSIDMVLKEFTKAKQTTARVHPTQKPLALMRWCLTFAPEAKTILDPFMGSGTTLLAAKLEGKQAVGIEINEAYCESAAKRLQQGLLF